MRPVIFIFLFSGFSATLAAAQFVNTDTLVPTLDYPDPDPVVVPVTRDTRRP